MPAFLTCLPPDQAGFKVKNKTNWHDEGVEVTHRGIMLPPAQDGQETAPRIVDPVPPQMLPSSLHPASAASKGLEGNKKNVCVQACSSCFFTGSSRRFRRTLEPVDSVQTSDQAHSDY